MKRLAAAVVATLLLATCSNSESSDSTELATTVQSTTVQSTTATTVAATEPPAETVGESTTSVDDQTFADRPYEVNVPSGYDAATPAPLVILLHGYGASGALQELYFKLGPQAEARGFLYVHPDATLNRLGDPAWNATDACCRDDDVDDSGYIMHIIDEVSATYNVDQQRIFLVGHSNGGFMSYRMACEHADRIAAIVSLAGATFLDAADCAPSEPVSVLQIHGTDDGTIEYDGGSTPIGEYPAAKTTVVTWSEYNGCSNPSDVPENLDLDSSSGAETQRFKWLDCPVDGAVELWTIEDGPHIPPLNADFAPTIIDWLFAHPNA